MMKYSLDEMREMDVLKLLCAIDAKMEHHFIDMEKLQKKMANLEREERLIAYLRENEYSEDEVLGALLNQKKQ